MPLKKSRYLIKFQIKEGVDEAICRNLKFAKKKMQQLGTIYPKKEIHVVISGTHSDITKKFSFKGMDWPETLDLLPEEQQ